MLFSKVRKGAEKSCEQGSRADPGGRSSQGRVLALAVYQPGVGWPF